MPIQMSADGKTRIQGKLITQEHSFGRIRGHEDLGESSLPRGGDQTSMTVIGEQQTDGTPQAQKAAVSGRPRDRGPEDKSKEYTQRTGFMDQPVSIVETTRLSAGARDGAAQNLPAFNLVEDPDQVR